MCVRDIECERVNISERENMIFYKQKINILLVVSVTPIFHLYSLIYSHFHSFSHRLSLTSTSSFTVFSSLSLDHSLTPLDSNSHSLRLHSLIHSSSLRLSSYIYINRQIFSHNSLIILLSLTLYL